MKLQTEYSDKRIKGYGCAVCSVISEVLRVSRIKEFPDEIMNKFLKIAYNNGSLDGNCWVMDWGRLGNTALDVLGIKGTCTLTIFQKSKDNVFLVSSGLYTNGLVWEHAQLNKPGWSHFLTKSYNPDPGIIISKNPTGLRGLNIDLY